MIEIRCIDLVPGPDNHIRILEVAVIASAAAAPLLTDTNGYWKAALWGLMLIIGVTEALLRRRQPRLRNMTLHRDGTVSLRPECGGELVGRVSPGTWFCDAFCILPVRLPDSRGLFGSLRTRHIVVAAANNSYDEYRIMRVWCRFEPWRAR